MLLAGAVATLVFCAPGYPGGAADAQPFLDAFAAAAAQAAQWPAESLAATYEATEAGGLAKLANPEAALAFVPFPFFVEHAAGLKLAPLVQADVTGVGVQERWTLVAKKGGVSSAASMSGYSILCWRSSRPDEQDPCSPRGRCPRGFPCRPVGGRAGTIRERRPGGAASCAGQGRAAVGGRGASRCRESVQNAGNRT